MRILRIEGKYESRLWIDDETKRILKIDCTCHDFAFRRIKRVGDFADAKYYATPCKHLKEITERMEKMGFKMKVPREMEGPDKLTSKIRRQLMERSQNKCERCGTDLLLEVHRKLRGSNGGKYNLENCEVLCRACHTTTHAGEFLSNTNK